MRALLVPRIVMASVVVVGLALAACATSLGARYYVLAPVSVKDAEPSAISEGITIGVRPVNLPDELDRPQIVTRRGPNTVHYAEFDRWSGSLREGVMQTIAANLATLLPGEQVAVYPWAPGTSVDRQVVVEITRFDGTLGGACTLEARWRVIGRGASAPPVHGQSTLTARTGGDYAAFVATQSRLVGALSVEIARAIRGSRAGLARD